MRAGLCCFAALLSSCSAIDLDALSFACESSADCAGGKACHPRSRVCVDPAQLGFCGDGQREGTETCDDGNELSGDGCSATCTIEQVTDLCGNAQIEGDERCDDGGNNNGDGCSAECAVEDGWSCDLDGCFRCGNGVRERTERCDDGNTSGGCVDCRVLFGWECRGALESTCTQVQYTQISAGGYHTCGLRAGGVLECTGQNEYPSAAATTNQATVPDDFPAASYVSAGHAHTCAIAVDRTLHCFGGNVGLVGEMLKQTDQAVVPTDLGPVAVLETGPIYTCALDDAGSARCWGEGGSGQTNPSTAALDQLGLGSFHGCGRRISDQRLECWGDTSSGRTQPPPVPFLQVSSGLFHSCGVNIDHRIECWGRDDAMGMRTFEPPGDDFAEIHSGHYFNCARRMNGSVICWGILPNAAPLVAVPEGSYLALTAGNEHACAIREDQTTVCWGVAGAW